MNGYFYMPVSTWMWCQLSLKKCKFKKFIMVQPMGQTQPLCEISTWPVTFSLQKSEKRCYFSKAGSSTCPLWGDEWQVWKSMRKGKQALEGWQLLCLAPADAAAGPPRTCLCAQLYSSASPAQPLRMTLCAWKAHSSIANGTWICCHMGGERYKAFAIAY